MAEKRKLPGAAFLRASAASPFARNVVTLMGGTIVAQALPILISPILTRLYTPAEFGVFAVYFSLSMFVAVAATGRYELAIMLPPNGRRAEALTVLSIALSVLTGLLSLGLVIAAGPAIATMLGEPALEPWLFLACPLVVLMASYNALTYWLNREARYARISGNRILQSGVLSVLQLGLGATARGGGGLMIGHFAAILVTTGLLARDFARSLGSGRNRAWLKDMLAVARHYSRHPKYMLIAQWVDKAAIEAPTIAIAALYGVRAAGFYMMANRIILLPTTLVSTAIGDVYRQRATEVHRAHKRFDRLFFRTFSLLAILAVPPFALVWLLAPDAFALVFGEEWRTSGEYTRVLIIGALFQFIFSPLDKGAVIVGAIRYILCWEFLRGLLVALAIFACWFWTLDVMMFVLFCALSSVIIFLVDGIVQWRLSRGGSRLAR